jgi:flagellar biosynthetic protein FlhB
MAEQELDRSEAATPYKLQKARERGQTAKSADVVSVTVFTVAMVFLAWQGAPSWRELFRFDAVLLSQAGRADSPAWLWSLVETMLRAGLKLAVPFFATVVVALKPDWSRLNPTTGFKRLFSLQTLFFAARSSLKLSLVSYVVYLALKGLIPHFHTFAGLSPAGSLQALLGGLASLGLEVSLVLGLIAIIDLVYSRRQFAKQMRMSRRELKEEIRHREGDPRIRARLRELRRELLKRSMALRKTREADVLVTNPTHVAVALRYVHGQMPAPKLVAKGAGFLAAVMRQIAARHRIPVVQNPSLARKLFHDLQVEQSVPPALYNQVARIIAWVFAMRDAAAKPKLPGALSAGGAPWRP